MIPFVKQPKMVIPLSHVTLQNIKHDPCEYMKYFFHNSRTLQEKIEIYNQLVKYCYEYENK